MMATEIVHLPADEFPPLSGVLPPRDREPTNLHYANCAVWTGDDPCDCSAAVDLEPCS